METIQQHEWYNWSSIDMVLSKEECKHCNCLKIWDAIEGVMYTKTKEVSYPMLAEEPPCITRQIPVFSGGHHQ